MNTFRGGQFIIEDKRKRKKKKSASLSSSEGGDSVTAAAAADGENSSENEAPRRKATMDDLKQGTQTLPSWAVVPKDATKFTDRK